MGNLTHKETSANVCLTFFIQHLVKKHQYILMEKFEPTMKNLKTILTAPFQYNQIIQFGDMYFFRLDYETEKRLEAENCLLYPFVSRICESDALTISSTYVDLDNRDNRNVNQEEEDDKNDNRPELPYPITYVIAYSQLNWCQVVATAMVTFRWNPFQKIIEPVISMLCSHQPNTDLALRRLQKIHNVDCSDNNTKPKDLCAELQRKAIEKSKIGLGIIMMYKALRDLKSAGYPYATLSADWSVWSYYVKKMKFRLGPNPFISSYLPKNWPVRANTGEYVNVVLMQGHVEEDKNLEGVWKKYYKTMAKPAHTFEQFMTHYSKYINLFDIYNPRIEQRPMVQLHFPLNNWTSREQEQGMIAEILAYEPNIVAILHASDVFVTNDDMKSIENMIFQAQCIQQFFKDPQSELEKNK